MPKLGFFWIFWRFQAASHISRAICTKINWNRHKEAGYEIFSIERRFRWYKSRFLGLRKPCTKASNSGTSVKVVFLPLFASLLWKWLQICMGMLPITASTGDELFSRINIDDFERLWTSKIMGFYWFLWSLAAACIVRMNCDEMAGDRLTVCKQELL